MCTDHPDHVHVPHVPDLGREPLEEWSGERVPLEPVDRVSILTLCDNAVDMLLMDQGPARRLGLAGGTGEIPTVEAFTLEEGKVLDPPLAQHGFAALVTVHKGGREHRFLFDTGLTPRGCVDNMRVLDVDPGDVEAIVCSHGHFDHATGLSGLADVLGRVNMPVLIHPEFWNRRRIAVPGREPFELPTTSKRALVDAGFEVIEERHPSFLFERSVLVTGEVDRTTDFETGFAFHEARRNDHWEPDPLILDDQALVVHVSGKGLVILTGCGHAGIVNIVRYAQRLTGVQQVYTVMGGFHLNGPLFEPVIGPTVDALGAIGPEVVVPAHCTGWKATHALAATLPDAFIPNSVGTTFELAPEPAG